MKRFLLLAILFLAWTPLAAARADEPGRKEVIYGRKYGTALTMDVFSPKKDANGAGVIFVVSGGWFSDHNAIAGNISTFIQPLCDRGYTVFAVCHGSSPKYALPEILEDMHRAVRFIRAGAKEYGIDPQRIGITGGSAGGHLALMQGCAGQDGNPKAPDPVNRQTSRVQAVVSFYPPTDFFNWGEPGKVMLGKHPIVPIKGAFDFRTLNPKTVSFELIIDPKVREQIGRDMSPINHVAKDNPPTLIIHGDKDALVPLQQAEIMAAKLKDAGVTAELIVKKGGGHDGALVKEHMPKMIEWFNKHLDAREQAAPPSSRATKLPILKVSVTNRFLSSSQGDHHGATSIFPAAALLIVIAANMPAHAGDQDLSGVWKLSHVIGGTLDQTLALVTLKSAAGKTTGELLAANSGAGNIVFKSVAQEGKLLHLVLQSGSVEIVFDTAVPQEAAKRLTGTVAIDGTLSPGWLAATDETTIERKSAVREVACPPIQQARALAAKANALRFRAQQAKDADQKEALQKQAAEADQAAKREAPKLYKEVLAKYADSPAVFEAALSLLRSPQAREAKLDEVESWANTAITAAQAYGPRWQAELAAQVAAALLAQDGLAKLAVDYARQAERLQTPPAPAAEQVRILTILTRALRKTGQNDAAKAFDARMARLDLILDREYLAKMPPFKSQPFAGRKSKSDRTVLMEMFTGATCPPCVAADLAFDVLQKTFKPVDLVLIQYHMHIPGPDPMTNLDTEARWAYYREAFPMEIRGVPSSLFNGKPAAGGGGGVAQAEAKHRAYRGVIEPLLEEPAAVKLLAKARREGDHIAIHVEVADLPEPSSNKKLYILLAEETVRYAGSNKIRMHHNVVRAGARGGLALTEAASIHKASINLADLRGQLTKYLDNYEINFRPFANPMRPLDFTHLRVIAFVQDDNTHDILQAVQVEVEGK